MKPGHRPPDRCGATTTDRGIGETDLRGVRGSRCRGPESTPPGGGARLRHSVAPGAWRIDAARPPRRQSPDLGRRGAGCSTVRRDVSGPSLPPAIRGTTVNMLRKITGTAGRFLSDTRGGATGIAAVGVTIMTMGGAALIIDHNQLVGQRDILKSASDAASLAATLEFNRLPDTLTEEQVRERILPLARKYAVLNVLGNVSDPDIEEGDVGITFSVDMGTRTVGTTIEANTGKTLVSGLLHGYSGPGNITVGSGVESVERTVEVVLAIDISNSMRNDLSGTDVGQADPTSRMSIVKAAALDLVGVLEPAEGIGVAVAIVPWDIRVRLERETREQWTANGWAVYPQSRHYPATYLCQPESSCTPSGANNTLPPSPSEPWRGCLDEHRVSGGLADLTLESEWLTPPSENPFAQGLYPAVFNRAYECMRNPTPANFRSQRCYGSRVDSIPTVIHRYDAQSCGGVRPKMLPLTTDRTRITEFIEALQPAGGATYSALGLLWGQRILSPEWRDIWGGDVHPMDQSTELRKAIVLLTDGQDNQCGTSDPTCQRTSVGYRRSTACAAVKATGTEIFVVAAMPPGEVQGTLGDALTACSSQGDREGTYVFLNNDDPETLRAAFTDIARQLRTVRRIY